MAGSLQQALARTDAAGTLEPYIEAYRLQSGRPTKYNEMMAAEIIDRLQNGETIRSICRSADMPNYSTVYDWQLRSPIFANAIAAARRGQATSFVEEALEIVDDAETLSMAHVQKADKRANLRMQLAKCFDREQYGDKVQQDVNVRGVVIHTDNSALAGLMNDD